MRKLLVSLVCLLSATSEVRARNILLIIADDLGTMNVGIYGESDTSPPTPTLDFLARRGVFFRNAWAFPSCSPTRAAIFTGRYAFRTGVGRNVYGTRVLQLEEVILPEVVRSVGYSSALIGKWHLGNENNGGVDGPNLAGWDHYAGSLLGAVPNYYWWPRHVNGIHGMSSTYATTDNVDEALSWIGGQSGPWFCTIAFNVPHEPFHAPPAHLHSSQLDGLDPRFEPLPFYHAMIQAMDAEMIKRLLTSLNASGRLTNTVIIFVGDNGVDDLVAEFPCVPGKGRVRPTSAAYECP